MTVREDIITELTAKPITKINKEPTKSNLDIFENESKLPKTFLTMANSMACQVPNHYQEPQNHLE